MLSNYIVTIDGVQLFTHAHSVTTLNTNHANYAINGVQLFTHTHSVTILITIHANYTINGVQLFTHAHSVTTLNTNHANYAKFSHSVNASACLRLISICQSALNS